MRGSTRQRRHEEEEESVFVSMTDMTVGFLFIVILLLAFFASQYNRSRLVPKPIYDQLESEHQTLQAQHETLRAERDRLQLEIERLRQQIETLEQRIAKLEEGIARLTATVASLTADLAKAGAERDRLAAELAQAKARVVELEKRIAELEAENARLHKPNPMQEYITNSVKARRHILEELRAFIKKDFPALDVELSEESLRFQGEGLFKKDQSAIRPESLKLIEAIAARLVQVLPCYTFGSESHFTDDCNGGFALVEAVQIEGHTDSDGNPMGNLVLSTNRATNTFQAMTKRQESLEKFLNLRRQPVLSVAGYGAMRPVAENDTAENKASNRRIDLRIIMHVPKDVGEIDEVRAQFTLDAQMKRP